MFIQYYRKPPSDQIQNQQRTYQIGQKTGQASTTRYKAYSMWRGTHCCLTALRWIVSIQEKKMWKDRNNIWLMSRVIEMVSAEILLKPSSSFFPPPSPLHASAHWPCHFWCSIGRRVHQIPSVTAKQPHNEKCLHISSVLQTVFQTKSPYRTCVLFTELIGGKINVLCISTVLLKQDKAHTSKSKAAAIEWIVW